MLAQVGVDLLARVVGHGPLDQLAQPLDGRPEHAILEWLA